MLVERITIHNYIVYKYRCYLPMETSEHDIHTP